MSKKKVITLLLTLAMILSLSVGVSAAETTEAKVPITLTVVNTVTPISCTVPACLPVSLVDGYVVCANNAAITNTGKTGAIKVTNVDVQAGTFEIGSYGRSHRWFHFWSDRKHRSTNGNRCWCRLRRFGSPAPMYGCRRKGRSRTHSCRRRAPCKRKCQDFLHNGTYNTRSTPDDLWMYASARRKCLAGNTDCSSGKYRQCRWRHTLR